MKRLLTYLITFSVIFSITSSSYIYAFASKYNSVFENNVEEGLDDIEAIHNNYQFNVTQKPKNVRKEYSQYSIADFTDYHEGYNSTMLVKVYVLHQSLLYYN